MLHVTRQQQKGHPKPLALRAARLTIALARAEGDDWEAEQRRVMALLATAFRRPHAEADGSASEQADRSAERPVLAPVPLSGAQLPEPEGQWRATAPLQQRGLNDVRAGCRIKATVETDMPLYPGSHPEVTD